MTPPMVDWTAAEREAVMAGLRDSGLTDGNDGNPHSWRCAYPDRYGPCECATETAGFVLDRLAPFVAERERQAAARALYHASNVAKRRESGDVSWLTLRAMAYSVPACTTCQPEDTTKAVAP